MREDLLKDILGQAAVAGIPPAEFAPRFRKALTSSPDPERALANYGRFLRAGFSTTLIRDFHAYPVLESVFLQIVSQSQYLADVLCRTPELLHWLTASNELTRTKSAADLLAEARQAIAPFERKERKLNGLKRFHRREMLRLGAREILGEAPHAVVAAELSSLADAVLDAVLSLAIDDLSNRFQRPFVFEFAVIGLGKLGGGELNFSSDIDLMFVYERDEEFRSPLDGALSLHQIYARLGEAMVRMLTEHTEEGYLYRVDMRLRPDGAAGPIAISRAAYLSYYESRGELWERQMLLKARVVAGDHEVGARFLEDVRPFVFPRSHARSPLEEIASIKKKIEQKLGEKENIKLGSGGIRDIEFIVQALQLIHAGVRPKLRLRGTLPALHALAIEGVLSVEREEQLRNAYEFFRTVEHRLQLLEGRQTHSLPETDEESHLLARRLGYDSAKPFRAKLLKHRTAVKRAFDQTFLHEARDRKSRNGRSSARSPGGSFSPELDDLLGQLHAILPSLSPGVLAAATRSAFRTAEAKSAALTMLNELARTETIRRTLVAAVANPKFLGLLLHTCARAPLVTRLMMHEPLFFESVAGMPALLHEPASGWEFIRDSDPGQYRTFNEARIVLRWLAGLIPIERMHEELSTLADEVVAACMRRVAAESKRAHAQTLVIVALGKAGGRELTVGADLDLLFVDAATKRAVQMNLDAIPRAFLSLIGSGIPPAYRVDLRLRPEGKNSPIVSSLPYVSEYFRGRAQLWERQSLLRARVLWGDGASASAVLADLHRIAYKTPLPPNWLEDLASMRHRIEMERGRSKKAGADLKTAAGGLLDVEFAVQALQLAYGAQEAGLRDPGTVAALGKMIGRKLVKVVEFRKLRADYVWMRNLELAMKMLGEDFAWPPAVGSQSVIAEAMNERTYEALDRRLRSIRARNKKSLERVFQTISAKKKD